MIDDYVANYAISAGCQSQFEGCTDNFCTPCLESSRKIARTEITSRLRNAEYLLRAFRYNVTERMADE